MVLQEEAAARISSTTTAVAEAEQLLQQLQQQAAAAAAAQWAKQLADQEAALQLERDKHQAEQVLLQCMHEHMILPSLNVTSILIAPTCCSLLYC